MAYENIQNAENGFSTIKGSFTALPLFAFFALEGVAADGIQWDDVENKTFDIGADGLTTKNTKPVLYTGTVNLKPNSSTRKYFDAIIAATGVSFGKTPTSVELTFTETNALTGEKTIYSGGDITSAPAGNSANLNDGQANKAYKVTFTSKTVLPL
jgi:hypothetical protein